VKRLGPNKNAWQTSLCCYSINAVVVREVGREAGEVIYTRRPKPAFCGYKQDYSEAKTCTYR